MIRVLVISDIHANITALDAVLADAGQVDEVWCLGDIAGYAADVNECIERIRNLPGLTCCMMGNHDYAAIGGIDLHVFNSDAKKALLWQRERITPENLAFLQTLSVKPNVCSEVTLAHGSPRDPVWEYVINTIIARINLEFFSTNWCLVGHTHFQVVFESHPDRDEIVIERPAASSRYTFHSRAILNPGSVGQPRDRDPRAAYAIFYPRELIWEPHRVSYDIGSVQNRILAAGLPPRHAERLANGW
jgi:diadenosine tetraphosphatase ApaH/serine/threonine PP2A family protein phosphatase